jgi:hypothetical protein
MNFNLGNIRLHNILITLILFFGGNLFAQNQTRIPTGTWRTHLSYHAPKFCESTQKYVYAATDNGLWRTDNFGQMTILRKTDGFQAEEITAMKFNESRNTLVIGYIDGGIDLLINDQRVVPVLGFKNKPLQGNKQINAISFERNDALITTEFGILILDLAKFEIRDSYTSIGDFGTQIAVKSACVVADSIYIATVDKIRSAPWNPLVNLNDYQQWNTLREIPFPLHLHNWNDTLIYESEKAIFTYYRGTHKPFYMSPERIADVFINNRGLHVIRPGLILNYHLGQIKTQPINLVVNATQAPDGIYWFCTGLKTGVIKKDPNGELSFRPNGPPNRSIFGMTQSGDWLVSAGGGVSATFGNAFNTSGYYLYNPQGWRSEIPSPLSRNLYDYIFVAHNPINNRYYAATHSFGMIEFTDGNITARFDETNSPLKRINDSMFIHIGGLGIDSKGGMWVVNRNNDKALLYRNPNGEWLSFNMRNNENDVVGIHIDNQDRKWFIMQGGGLWVFHEGKSISSTGDDQWVRLTQNNGLVSNQVLSVKSDKNGYVWIGTNQGLNIFTGRNPFSNPKVERFIVEQDGAVGYLMGEEYIRDILVDGGNRKWFATTNGVFCIDEYGQRVIKHFTKENSPLLSNRTICLGQVDYSSELFIGTDFGIISLQNDAGKGSDAFGEIKVYPNPVYPKYDGEITIDGLAQNSEIRIADVQGRLVYQTKSNGSKATWNGYRLDGTRPNSGVYFIFAINRDGSETALGKFVFIQ